MIISGAVRFIWIWLIYCIEKKKEFCASYSKMVQFRERNDVKMKEFIENGKGVLGIELGSTRIKAVLIDDNFKVISSGSHDWENSFENGLWTYRLEDAWEGIRNSYKKLCEKLKSTYGVELKKLKAIGFSGMMHGYLPFDKDGNQLAEFRTWRNTNTGEAAEFLTKEFNFNIPHRWSIAHLYQAILDGDSCVQDIDYLTTLAGHIHHKLTGKRVMGVGEASGMFPIDSNTVDFNESMIDKFHEIIKGKFNWSFRDIFPKVLKAGENAGFLTEEGARLIDPSGNLESGIPMCPPEGDAGTGMVATNSISERTGNVSAGTSIFAMIVLEKELTKVYEEIDMVTTPSGNPVAMVHCNNCSSDIDAWAQIFKEFSVALGNPCTIYQALDTLFYEALKGEVDAGGIISYNYFSGEPITKLSEGRPLLVRSVNSDFSFANFAKSILYSAVATLKLGIDILDDEDVSIDKLLGHGGFFKAREVGQRIMSSAVKIPVSVMETAGEGGAWGIAVLADYCVEKDSNLDFASYLNSKVFANSEINTVMANKSEIEGFTKFIDKYVKGLEIEKAAVNSID